jgi:hypothetical protein
MKMAKVTTRVQWTPEHVEGMLDLYFSFLKLQREGTAYQKAAPIRELAARQCRSKGSVEAKMMNVSAVLDQCGHDWVNGFKPLTNYNKALFDQVAEYMVEHKTRRAA